MSQGLKIGSVVGILALVCSVMVCNVSADPAKETYLLKVEVEKQQGDDAKDKVSISAPMSLFQIVFDLIPSEVKKPLEEKGIKLEQMLQEIEKLQGQDLVRIKGPDNVRIWVEPVTSENQKDVGFLKVNVVKTGKEKQDINICVPKGLIKLISNAAKALGIPAKLDIPGLKELREKG